MFSIFKKAQPQELQFNIESLPFIYHSEFYSLAWGCQHRGFYIIPDGTKYDYDMPEVWNFHTSVAVNQSDTPFKSVKGIELDGVIKSEQLFQNLSYSNKRSSFFGRKPLDLPYSTIEEIMNAEVEGSTEYQVKCDAGIRTNCLLVYQPEQMLYKRMILSVDGDYRLHNCNTYAKRLVANLSKEFRAY